MTANVLTHRRPSFAPHRTGGSTRSTREHHSEDAHGDGSTRAHWIKILEITAVIVIAIALIAATVVTSRPHVQAPLKTTRVFVEKGDTLWSLAQAHPISGQTTEQTAQLIAELNSLDSSGVAAGHVVKLPQTEEQAPMFAQR